MLLKSLTLLILLFSNAISAQTVLPGCTSEKACEIVPGIAGEFTALKKAILYNEISKAAIEDSLSNYANALLLSPQIKSLRCDDKDSLKKIIKHLVLSDLDAAAGSSAASTLSRCSIEFNLDLNRLLPAIIDRTTAYVCGELGNLQSEFRCRNLDLKKERLLAHEHYQSRLVAAATDLRALDEKINALVHEYKDKLRDVSCTSAENKTSSTIIELESSAVCTRHGVRLAAAESAYYSNILEAFEFLSNRKLQLLYTWPELGISGAPGTDFQAKTGILDALVTPIENFNAPKDQKRVYERLLKVERPYPEVEGFASTLDTGKDANHNAAVIDWAQQQSRRGMASIALSHICGGAAGPADRESISHELILSASPIVGAVIAKEKYLAPLYCKARNDVQDRQLTDAKKKAAVALSATALGIAAAPLSGYTSIGLLAASSGLGLGLTVNTTQIAMNESELGQALNQVCEVGFNEMASREEEVIRAQNQAIRNYALEGGGWSVTALKAATMAPKIYSRVIPKLAPRPPKSARPFVVKAATDPAPVVAKIQFKAPTIVNEPTPNVSGDNSKAIVPAKVKTKSKPSAGSKLDRTLARAKGKVATPASPKKEKYLVPDGESFAPAKNYWSTGNIGDYRKNADIHFLEHGREFGAESTTEYVNMAYHFAKRKAAPKEIWTVTADHVVYRYDHKENIFLVMNYEGEVKTFYRPAFAPGDNPLSLFRRKIKKPDWSPN